MKRICISLLFSISALSAQTNRGGITGAITDQSGAVIPSAGVTVTNIGTNQVKRMNASPAGVYSVPDLEPVHYRVEVQAAGFKKAVVEDVKVDTASIATVNVTLEPGVVATEVSVTAEAPLVNADSGTTGQTITERQIDNTPLQNRSVLDLAVLVPNVSGDVGSEEPGVTSGSPVPGFNLNLNGGRSGTSLMLADGVNNTGVGLARAVVTFSPETVQEFTVQTSAYSAEYGTTGGGVINITTKSGTNQFHGIGLWYSRNPALGAAPFTTASVNRPVSNLRDNQFSFSAGGPVVISKLYNGRNRMFFFGAIEPRRRTDHIQADAILPTEAMRNGNFSNTVLVPASGNQGNDPAVVPASVAAQFQIAPVGDAAIYQHYASVGNQLQRLPPPAAGQTFAPFPGNIIPKSLIDPVALKLLQYVPEPQDYYLNSNGFLVNYTLQRFVKDDNTRYTARIDQVLTDSNRLSFRMTFLPIVGVTGFGSPVNGNGGSYSSSRQFMLSETATITPRLVNDLRLNYTRGRFSGTFSPEFDVKTGRNLSTELGLPSLTKGGLPLFQIGAGTFGNIGSQGSTLNDNVEERYNIADTLYMNKGSMSWKFGVDLNHALLNELSFYSAAGGNYFFRYLQTNSTGTSAGTGGMDFASFLLGVPNNLALANAVLPYYYRWNSAAAFVQNDWKVKPNLTLNLGLRYSLQLPRTEKYNHQGSFLPQLAREYPLPQPLTLIDGETISSVSVPPFALSGVGGRSQYLWPIRWNDFEPRFGFAYVPKLFGWNTSGTLIVRGGYGLSHAPLTGQNRLPSPNFATPSRNYGETSGQTNTAYVMRLSSNPPLDTPVSWNQILGSPENGLIYLPSINYQGSGFVLSPNMKTPYAQNWNFTLSYQPARNTVVEIAYVGNKGTHLFMPRINANPSGLQLIDALYVNNVGVTSTVPDPLGRTDANGRVLTVQNGSLGSKYLGFNSLYTQYDSSANSIRHAAYVSIVRRPSKGLFLSANYTFGKSIDDASDASPDKGTLTTQSLGGEVSFGGTRTNDRSVSTFDVTHILVASFMYDLPFGHGRTFFTSLPGFLNAVIGNWMVSGIERLHSGYPFLVTIPDSNLLGDTTQTHTLRPDIVPGVPLVNPLWTRTCPVGNQCQPYLNPAAFERPPVGSLGNTPRTIDSVRGPMQQLLDLSVQKNIPIKEGRFRIQLRVDALNAFNHPILVPSSTSTNTGTGSDFMGQPSSTPITAAQYNSWAAANGKPLASTPAGAALLAQVQAFVTANRLPSGALPANFFSVPVPQGFARLAASSFDITTLSGYKLFVLRNAYGTPNFGTLYAPSIPRHIQFGIKFYF